jgi:hypothetical protein
MLVWFNKKGYVNKLFRSLGKEVVTYSTSLIAEDRMYLSGNMELKLGWSGLEKTSIFKSRNRVTGNIERNTPNNLIFIVTL